MFLAGLCLTNLASAGAAIGYNHSVQLKKKNQWFHCLPAGLGELIAGEGNRKQEGLE